MSEEEAKFYMLTKKEFERGQGEIDRLKAENAKLRELVELAVQDIKRPSVCDCCQRGCQGDEICIDNSYMNFSWRNRKLLDR